jgi:hypothetical protein
MITGAQIRHARKLLGWERYKLAQRAKVHSSIIERARVSRVSWIAPAVLGSSCARPRSADRRMLPLFSGGAKYGRPSPQGHGAARQPLPICDDAGAHNTANKKSLVMPACWPPGGPPQISRDRRLRTPDQFARKSVHNGRNPANTVTSHSPKVTADQGLGSSSRKTTKARYVAVGEARSTQRLKMPVLKIGVRADCGDFHLSSSLNRTGIMARAFTPSSAPFSITDSR